MVKISPENNNEKKNEQTTSNWQNIFAFLTMPMEGIFFFGTIMGYPNLAEIFKKLHVYENLCDINSNSTQMLDNGMINCPARDTMFS